MEAQSRVNRASTPRRIAVKEVIMIRKLLFFQNERTSNLSENLKRTPMRRTAATPTVTPSRRLAVMLLLSE
jgi:hypothetical protein